MINNHILVLSALLCFMLGSIVVNATEFEACPGVENQLGISELELMTRGLPFGFVSGKVVHDPTITLDGPAFVQIEIGPLKFFKDFCNDIIFNPEGCPVTPGTTNKLYPAIFSKKLAMAYNTADVGTTVPITIKGFLINSDEKSITNLGCIRTSITKEKESFPLYSMNEYHQITSHAPHTHH